ncbi:hypothetical protein C8J57DRAFT_1542523 [Mycena rebaudengoi]|nr:hypothetical protein C8J57DRAFT_1542523 [Mycena rebaudengoi]
MLPQPDQKPPVTTDPESNTSSANSQELQVLLSRVATLVQMSLDMAKFTLFPDRLPIVLAHHVDEALAGIPQLVAEQVAVEVAAKTAGRRCSCSWRQPSPVAEFVRGNCDHSQCPSNLFTLLAMETTSPGNGGTSPPSDELTNGVPKYMRRRKILSPRGP